jgi:hypothetical protein
MSIKTKTTTVAALAALTLPSAALAHGGEKNGRGHDNDHAGTSDSRGDQGARGDCGDKGGHHGWHQGRRAFFLTGTDVAGLTVTDGKLAGPITLDPTFASAKAFKTLGLTRDKVKSEETIQVGAAGDDVEVKYKGLQATDAIAPTDYIAIFAKTDRETGALDIKKIKVWRKAAPTS